MATIPETKQPSIAEKGKATRFVAGASQVEIARKGAEATNRIKKEKRLIKDEILKRMGEEEWDKVINNMIRRAMETNDGFCTLRDSIGQKPVTEVKADLEAEVVIDAKMK